MTMDDIYSGTITKEQLAHTPSKLDIRQTKQLFRDFCIVADIPQFATISALLYWRKEMILTKLKGVTI